MVPEPKHDTVIVVTEDDIMNALGGAHEIQQHGIGVLLVDGIEREKVGDSDRAVLFDPIVATRLRNGEAVNYRAETPISLIHEDYAGTPKSDDVIAERMFERFKNSDGEARSVALEALHLLGYKVEKEYTLVEK